jgi:hypothetical protein
MTRTLPALTLLALVVGSPAPAGTISIAPSTPTGKLGQTVTFTVSVDSAAPMPTPDDGLFIASSVLTVSAHVPVAFTNFRVDPALPPGFTFAGTDPTSGSATIDSIEQPNGLTSYRGPTYEFDFLAESAGTYVFTFVSNDRGDFNYIDYISSRDVLTQTGPLTFVVEPNIVFPEPGSLALAGVCLAGLGVRAWRKRSL